MHPWLLSTNRTHHVIPSPSTKSKKLICCITIATDVSVLECATHLNQPTKYMCHAIDHAAGIKIHRIRVC